MQVNKWLASTIIIMAYFSSCGTSQNKYPANTKLISDCEGCEAVFEYKAENRVLMNVDTLPEFAEGGEQLKVSGIVYKPGGTEPANDVILYIHQTNHEGIYPKKGDEKGWARRHGYLRGWVKTGSDGRYTFYTIKPGNYPQRSSPAHIHLTILEPDGKYYWAQDFLFEGDPWLNENQLSSSPRGGNTGILQLHQVGKLWVGTRDLELGKNIEGYE